MGYKKIKLVILALVAITILATHSSLTITKNTYDGKTPEVKSTETTTYVVKMNNNLL